MHGSRLTTLTVRKLWEKQCQCSDRFDRSGHYVTVFIIVSGQLTAASGNVNNALQIGKACMEAYANKLPQGFYNKIRSYVVTMDTTEDLALSVQKSLITVLRLR